MAVTLSVHDNRRSVQKLTAAGRGVQNAAEGRHDHRQYRRSGLIYIILLPIIP